MLTCSALAGFFFLLIFIFIIFTIIIIIILIIFTWSTLAEFLNRRGKFLLADLLVLLRFRLGS